MNQFTFADPPSFQRKAGEAAHVTRQGKSVRGFLGYQSFGTRAEDKAERFHPTSLRRDANRSAPFHSVRP